MLYLAYKKFEHNRELKKHMPNNSINCNNSHTSNDSTFDNNDTCDAKNGNKYSKLVLYRGGILTGLLNPKAILLFSVIFPRFLLHSQHLTIDCTILGCTFLLLQFSSGCCYTYFGQSLNFFLLSSKNQQLINAIVAVVFIIIAILFSLIRVD